MVPFLPDTGHGIWMQLSSLSNGSVFFYENGCIFTQNTPNYLKALQNILIYYNPPNHLF